jgi:N-acetyl sugar amidotransferase
MGHTAQIAPDSRKTPALRYCKLCVLPNTRPNLAFDVSGVCQACRTHAQRPDVDWAAREKDFRALADGVKRRTSGYDCVVPVSGGKDSTWQILKCLEYGLRPLAVTWKTPARTAVGQQNLDNLVALGVDHIDWQVNPKVEARFMLKAFERFGSTAIPMHLAIFSMPLRIAADFGIPLVVWGENSAIEYGNAEVAQAGHKLDRKWLKTYGVTHGTSAADWVDSDLSSKDLAAYFGPDPDALEARGTRAVFLGHYFAWDPEATHAVARAHGFRGNSEGSRTGYYDFADIDDDFISIHHWMKWYKFGFTRLFDNLALEIRNGRMTREQAIDVIRRGGDQTPLKDIKKFCAFAGIPPSRFFDIAERFRNHDIWLQKDGNWTIPGFLIPDWDWREVHTD